MQSKAFLSRGNIQTVNVKALAARIGYFHMKYFFHFLQIWVEKKKIYGTVILHYMIFLSRGEN